MQKEHEATTHALETLVVAHEVSLEPLSIWATCCQAVAAVTLLAKLEPPQRPQRLQDLGEPGEVALLVQTL